MNSSNNRSKDIIIAIDGYSSCGKSTFAKAIASRLGYIFIDTGAMYRAVALTAMESGAVVDGRIDAERVIALLPSISMSFSFNAERGASDIYVNGRRVEEQIRTIEVSDFVSEVSSIAQVRTKLVSMQQQMGQSGGVVMDGRDIGTVVFPEAQIKIFMTADPYIRAQRRFRELSAKGESTSLEAIERNIRERDHADENRAISPLRRADDAVLLDNSTMRIEEQMTWFDELFEQRTK